jgi:uncharacterized protein YegP (UPF0339 family)
MIKDFFNSFRDNIVTKTTNPFFGTLILIWLTKNWNLIYSLLNFDPNTKLDDKRAFIIEHFTDKPFYKTLWICVGYTFLIIIITYVLINLTRAISNLYEKKLTPWIYKKTDKSSIVLRDEYDSLMNHYNRVDLKWREEIADKIRLQDQISSLEARLKGHQETISAQNLALEDAKRSKERQVKDHIGIIVNKLIEEERLDRFVQVVRGIKNNYTFSNIDLGLEEFTFLDLIRPAEKDGRGQYFYNLTNLGDEVYQRIKHLQNLKFIVTERTNGEFQFNLQAGNGQVILTSEGYTTRAGCDNGIDSVRRNSQNDDRYVRKTLANGKAYFNLTAANGQVIGTSEMYESTASRDASIASIMRNAPSANVIYSQELLKHPIE